MFKRESTTLRSSPTSSTAAVQFYTDVLGFKVRGTRTHRLDAAMGVTLDLVYLDLGGRGSRLIR